MRLTSFTPHLAALALLGGLLACGGAYTPPPVSAAPTATPTPASGLVYTDPTSTGWRLVQDPTSTPTHLVLNLLGPNGAQARGVGFNLTSDGTVAFHAYADPNNTVTGKTFVQPGTVFKLKLNPDTSLFETKYNYLYQPVLAVGGVKNGGKLLTVGVFQKDRLQPAATFDATPLLQIGIDLPATGGPSVGQAIPLTVIRARAIPADLGTVPATIYDNWSSVVNTFHMQDIQIAVGSLHAK